MKKEQIEVPLATLEFYKYKENGLVYYEFDARECTPPEPMVNAMYGLKMLQNENERLVGIFFHEPFPLYQKTSANFEHESRELESGDYQVIFKKISVI